MKNLNAQNLLKDAARLLEKVGWVRGTNKRVSSKGEVLGYCATGAIRSAAYRGGYNVAVTNEAVFVASRVVGMDIVEYNDHIADDKRYVTRAFRRAAKSI